MYPGIETQIRVQHSRRRHHHHHHHQHQHPHHPHPHQQQQQHHHHHHHHHHRHHRPPKRSAKKKWHCVNYVVLFKWTWSGLCSNAPSKKSWVQTKALISWTPKKSIHSDLLTISIMSLDVSWHTPLPPPGKLTWKWKHKYIWVDITPKKRFVGDFSSPISVFWRGVNPFPQVDTKTIGAITLIRSPFFHSPLVSTPLASTSLYSFGHVVFFFGKKNRHLKNASFPLFCKLLTTGNCFFAYKKNVDFQDASKTPIQHFRYGSILGLTPRTSARLLI